MNEKVYLLKVYNTTTGEYESVQVTKEVFEEYRRLGWDARNKDRRWHAHEIQYSGLIGGEDSNYENFREFINADDTPENAYLEASVRQSLHNILGLLTPDEYRLIYALFFQEMSEEAYGRKIGISQQAVHKCKIRILKKLKNFLDWEGC